MNATNNVLNGIIIATLGFGGIPLSEHFGVDFFWVRALCLGVTIFGAVFFIVGLYGLAMQLREPQGVHKDDAAIASTALIRAMVAVSIADESLHDREADLIARIYKQMTGSTISADTIQKTAYHMKSQGVEIRDEMKRLRGIAGADLKVKIIKASLHILAADGTIAEEEDFILTEIRKGLGVSSGRLKREKKEFFKAKGLT
ncbi:MAG: TerB family tellurite resistance protein [Alphaproteobacteria bacterium]|nr:TerB family tellurite resistance protein [Alphaproteobacteria bacterium]